MKNSHGLGLSRVVGICNWLKVSLAGKVRYAGCDSPSLPFPSGELSLEIRTKAWVLRFLETEGIA